ncbi:MAG TPA: hypothetical protein VHU88_20675, partial [Sporichthyaceae bacterium]|nr:hypothetical protein [Sporichthyaceae bacterium]
MDNAVLGSVSEFETALSVARKYLENELWSCSGSEVSDLLRQLHRLRAQIESMELTVLREVIERGVPAEVG